jgi:uncharacterized membrane protein
MGEELVLTLLGLGVLLALAAAVLVLPILALIRTGRISQLAERLDRLERIAEWDAAHPAPRRETRPETPAPVEVVPTAEAVPVAEVEPLEALPGPPRRHHRRGQQPDAAAVEAWIGRHALGWIAVVLLLFAAAFFLKHIFENRWIGELGRVALGIAGGAALCVAGFHYHRRGWRIFSQMLTAGGVVLVYLATFGAFGYYHLVPQERAAIFLAILVAEVAALALLFEAPAIAIMAVIGGLLNPLLLHTERDQYLSLFVYLAILDAATVALALFRRWPAIGTIALLGTHGIFWLWYDEHYHPAKLQAAITFQAVIFGLFLLQGLAGRGRAGIEDLIRILLNGLLFGLAAYVLLNPKHHVWMGTLSLALATLYAALAWFAFARRPGDEPRFLTLFAVGTGLVAAAFAFQAEAAWIALSWAIEGLVLWTFGVRVHSEVLRALGAELLILAVGRLILVDTPYAGRPPFIPFLNKYGLPASGIAACVLLAAAVSRRLWPHPRPIDLIAAGIGGVVGVLVVWFVLSIEAYGYFTAKIDQRMAEVARQRGEIVTPEGRDWTQEQYEEADRLWRAARTSLSVVWAVYAGIVLALGLWLRNRPLRWTALGMFAVTLGKVILIDMAGLPGFYRVAAFFVLAVVLGIGAWGYQKLKPSHEEAEGVAHEAV